MLNPYPIDLDEFRSWLLAQSSTAVVGTACDDEACPLVSFLNAQYEGSSFMVHTSDYERLMDDVNLGRELESTLLVLPEWASVFVWVVDDVFGTESPIYQNEALRWLDRVCGALNSSVEVRYV